MNILRLILVLLGVQLAAPLAAVEIESSILHDGERRGYRLYLPSAYDPLTPMPLVVALHGRASNARRMANLTGFDARAEQHGFIVVYPDSLQERWNYLDGIPGAANGPDDVGFLFELVARLDASYAIDGARRYVTGISNGGFMAQRLACASETPFAGFASVAAGGFAAMQDNCDRGRPLDALYLHGTDDRLVPWEGLAVEDADGDRQIVTWSLKRSVRFWAERNQCVEEVDVFEVEPAGRSPFTRVRIIASQACQNNVDVLLYAIIGGGHNWPGVAGFIPESVSGRVNLDIHASDVIWSFFDRAHRWQ